MAADMLATFNLSKSNVSTLVGEAFHLEDASLAHPGGGNLCPTDQNLLKLLQDIMYTIVTPILCIVGLLGNIINIIVLTTKRFRIRTAEGQLNPTQIALFLLALLLKI